jgi:hypothetical protein
MKLNTKKTERECECTCHLNPLNKTLGKVKYCSKCICMHTDSQPAEKPMAWEIRLNGLIPNAVFKVENENRKDKGIVTVDRSSVKQFIKNLLEEERECVCDWSFEHNPTVICPVHPIDKTLERRDSECRFYDELDFNLAEYKQKLIKRLKKTRTPMSGKEKNWWIDFNTVKKALDEVEAVIKLSQEEE